jgi:hypothetical protein
MILEARSAGCFSWTFVLKLNDRAIGKFDGQWLSENLTIEMNKRRAFEFRKVNWLGSQFELVDLARDEIVAWCDRSGMFSSTWNLSLNAGDGQLVLCGWFNSAYEFILRDEALARVDRIAWCERGWSVDGGADLNDEDLLMIGLVYHIIQTRQQSQHNAPGGAAAAGT